MVKEFLLSLIHIYGCMFSYEVIQSLNDLELSVYNYIVENSHKIIKMKIKDVANEAHVSTTTILRFCKKLGCDGYSEFKVKFKLYLDKKVENGQKDDLDEIVDLSLIHILS